MKRPVNAWALLAYGALGLAIAVSIVRRLPQQPATPPLEEPASWENVYEPPPEPLTRGPLAPRYVRWCQAREVLQQRCQRCHGSPLSHGAPFPLVEYEDTQRERPIGSGLPTSVRMLQVVRHRIMPPVDQEIVPTVEPLTEAQKDVLLVWLEEGALPYGGTECDNDVPSAASAKLLRNDVAPVASARPDP